MKTAQALALFDGADFVTPEQIQSLAGPVIAHRLVLEPQARFSGVTARGMVEEAIKKLRGAPRIHRSSNTICRSSSRDNAARR